jgi:hypothetical protein
VVVLAVGNLVGMSKRKITPVYDSDFDLSDGSSEDDPSIVIVNVRFLK